MVFAAGLTLKRSPLNRPPWVSPVKPATRRLTRLGAASESLLIENETLSEPPGTIGKRLVMLKAWASRTAGSAAGLGGVHCSKSPAALGVPGGVPGGACGLPVKRSKTD